MSASSPYSGPERRAAPTAAQGTDSHAKLFGHPLHQQLVVFPLGLLATSVLFDLLCLATGATTLAEASFWMMVAGLVGGVLAAPFGLVDWLNVPRGTRAKRIGLVHALTNVSVLALFACSAWLRSPAPGEPSAIALALSFGGGALALVGAWLGGELVHRLGIGVSATAGPDAGSSLRKH